MRPLASGFLLLQGGGVLAWWVLMLVSPSARQPFLAPGAPDVTLLAFVGSDLALYGGGSVLAAYGVAGRRAWAWPVLCVHAGAGTYAALYGLALPLFSGGGWLGAVLMAPSLVVLPLLVWRLRPARLL